MTPLSKASPGALRMPAAHPGKRWTEQGLDCVYAETNGVRLLTIEVPQLATAWHEIVRDEDQARAYAREFAPVLRKGGSPKVGVFRRLQVAEMAKAVHTRTLRELLKGVKKGTRKKGNPEYEQAPPYRKKRPDAAAGGASSGVEQIPAAPFGPQPAAKDPPPRRGVQASRNVKREIRKRDAAAEPTRVNHDHAPVLRHLLEHHTQREADAWRRHNRRPNEGWGHHGNNHGVARERLAHALDNMARPGAREAIAAAYRASNAADAWDPRGKERGLGQRAREFVEDIGHRALRAMGKAEPGVVFYVDLSKARTPAVRWVYHDHYVPGAVRAEGSKKGTWKTRADQFDHRAHAEALRQELRDLPRHPNDGTARRLLDSAANWHDMAAVSGEHVSEAHAKTERAHAELRRFKKDRARDAKRAERAEAAAKKKAERDEANNAGLTPEQREYKAKKAEWKAMNSTPIRQRQPGHGDRMAALKKELRNHPGRPDKRPGMSRKDPAGMKPAALRAEIETLTDTSNPKVAARRRAVQGALDHYEHIPHHHEAEATTLETQASEQEGLAQKHAERPHIAGEHARAARLLRSAAGRHRKAAAAAKGEEHTANELRAMAEHGDDRAEAMDAVHRAKRKAETLYEDPVVWRGNPKHVAAAIRAVRGAVSTEKGRYGLTGIHTEVDPDGTLRVVATDGHRLHIAEIQGAADGFSGPLARRQIAEPEQLLNDTRDGTLRRSAADIDGEFPDYRSVLPDTDTDHHITFDKAKLIAELRDHLKHRGKREAAATEFHPTPDGYELRSVRDGDEPTNERVKASHVPAAVSGKIAGQVFGFNARLLLEALEHTPGKTVRLHTSDALHPAGIVGDRSGPVKMSHVVMPMRVDGGRNPPPKGREPAPRDTVATSPKKRRRTVAARKGILFVLDLAKARRGAHNKLPTDVEKVDKRGRKYWGPPDRVAKGKVAPETREQAGARIRDHARKVAFLHHQWRTATDPEWKEVHAEELGKLDVHIDHRGIPQRHPRPLSKKSHPVHHVAHHEDHAFNLRQEAEVASGAGNAEGSFLLRVAARRHDTAADAWDKASRETAPGDRSRLTEDAKRFAAHAHEYAAWARGGGKGPAPEMRGPPAAAEPERPTTPPAAKVAEPTPKAAPPPVAPPPVAAPAPKRKRGPTKAQREREAARSNEALERARQRDALVQPIIQHHRDAMDHHAEHEDDPEHAAAHAAHMEAQAAIGRPDYRQKREAADTASAKANAGRPSEDGETWTADDHADKRDDHRRIGNGLERMAHAIEHVDRQNGKWAPNKTAAALRAFAKRQHAAADAHDRAVQSRAEADETPDDYRDTSDTHEQFKAHEYSASAEPKNEAERGFLEGRGVPKAALDVSRSWPETEHSPRLHKGLRFFLDLSNAAPAPDGIRDDVLEKGVIANLRGWYRHPRTGEHRQTVEGPDGQSTVHAYRDVAHADAASTFHRQEMRAALGTMRQHDPAHAYQRAFDRGERGAVMEPSPEYKHAVNAYHFHRYHHERALEAARNPRAVRVNGRSWIGTTRRTGSDEGYAHWTKPTTEHWTERVGHFTRAGSRLPTSRMTKSSPVSLGRGAAFFLDLSKAGKKGSGKKPSESDLMDAMIGPRTTWAEPAKDVDHYHHATQDRVASERAFVSARTLKGPERAQREALGHALHAKARSHEHHGNAMAWGGDPSRHQHTRSGIHWEAAHAAWMRVANGDTSAEAHDAAHHATREAHDHSEIAEPPSATGLKAATAAMSKRAAAAAAGPKPRKTRAPKAPSAEAATPATPAASAPEPKAPRARKPKAAATPDAVPAPPKAPRKPRAPKTVPVAKAVRFYLDLAKAQSVTGIHDQLRDALRAWGTDPSHAEHQAAVRGVGRRMIAHNGLTHAYGTSEGRHAFGTDLPEGHHGDFGIHTWSGHVHIHPDSARQAVAWAGSGKHLTEAPPNHVHAVHVLVHEMHHASSPVAREAYHHESGLGSFLEETTNEAATRHAMKEHFGTHSPTLYSSHLSRTHAALSSALHDHADNEHVHYGYPDKMAPILERASLRFKRRTGGSLKTPEDVAHAFAEDVVSETPLKPGASRDAAHASVMRALTGGR